MREANEDLKVVSKPEWRTPVITKFAAEDAEGNAQHHVPDGVASTS